MQIERAIQAVQSLFQAVQTRAKTMTKFASMVPFSVQAIRCWVNSRRRSQQASASSNAPHPQNNVLLKSESASRESGNARFQARRSMRAL